LRRDFLGHEVGHLYAPWLLHAGLSPDHAAGGLMTPLFAGTLHGFGLPVVAGGAGRFVAAFRSLLDSLGVFPIGRSFGSNPPSSRQTVRTRYW